MSDMLESNEALMLAGFRLDPVGKALIAANGTALPLTKQLVKVAALFASNPGKAMPAQDIFTTVTGMRFGEIETNVSQMVTRLRKLVGDTDKKILAHSRATKGYTYSPPGQ